MQFGLIEQFSRLVELSLVKLVLPFAHFAKLLDFAVSDQEVLEVDKLAEAGERGDLEHGIDRIDIFTHLSLLVFV